MGVVKEFVCMAHGPFDGEEARCPAGCTTNIEREFRTAPAARSDRTKAVDNALSRLAGQYGFSDISNRNGSVAQSRPRAPVQDGAPPGFDLTPRWESVPKGHIFHAGGRIEEREGAEGGATVPAGQYHSNESMGKKLGLPSNRWETLASENVPLPLGQLPPRPRPRVVAKDNVSAADFSAAVNSSQ